MELVLHHVPLLQSLAPHCQLLAGLVVVGHQAARRSVGHEAAALAMTGFQMAELQTKLVECYDSQPLSAVYTAAVECSIRLLTMLTHVQCYNYGHSWFKSKK